MPPQLLSAALNFTQSLLVVCCNGGLPFVDLHVWPIDGAVFHPLDPTDWVATHTDSSQLNTSLHPEVEKYVSTLNLPENIDLSICDAYNLTFSSQTLRDVFNTRNGTLACRCPRAYYGTSCQLLDSQGIIPIIPLSFALFAAIGGFMCKMCCCDCYNINCSSCSGKDPEELPENDDDLWDDDTQPLDENTYNRCLEAAQGRPKAYHAKSDETPETSQFIPTLISAGTTNKFGFTPLVPVPPYSVKSSPPPSYKADDSPKICGARQSRPRSIDASTQTVIW